MRQRHRSSEKNSENLVSPRLHRKKSLLWAYCLWLFGGFWGMHLIYVGRDWHGFVHGISFGGFFGIGWIRDAFKLPSYIRLVNDEDVHYIIRQQISRNMVPDLKWHRVFIEYLVSEIFGYVALLMFPYEWVQLYGEWVKLLWLIVPLACALGVHLVGSVGETRGFFRNAFVGAYITSPALFFMTNGTTYVTFGALIAYNYMGREFSLDFHPDNKHFLWRFGKVFLAWGLFYSLVFLALYHNASVTTAHGERVRFRDGFHHFVRSPAWGDFAEVIKKLATGEERPGWGRFYDSFVRSLDPLGERSALDILDFPHGHRAPEQKVIKERCRELQKKYHPDKVVIDDPGERKTEEAFAADRFMEVQDACGRLLDIYARRASKKKSRVEDEL